jgi:peroxiredoxin
MQKHNLRPPLEMGDLAPPCVLPTLDGDRVDLRSDAVAAKPIVILFCPHFVPAVVEALAAMNALRPSFTESGALVFAVTLESAKIAAAQGIGFPVLLDRSGDVFRAFSADTRDLPTVVVLRPNQHVRAVLNSAPSTLADQALAQVVDLAAERQPVLMTPHPPVLIVPDVLSPADCQRLITVYETRGQTFVEPGPDVPVGTDYKMRIPEHGRRDRIDHWIVDEDTMTFVHRRVQLRLLPEIAKAFQYPVTRWERMRIGCYEGDRGGKLHGHRDNVAPTPYRRFAMSINLNVDQFSGGELRFPEFGDQRYRPDSGSAIVFSSSLLHEALHVTAGRRLVLLAFLFGDR